MQIGQSSLRGGWANNCVSNNSANSVACFVQSDNRSDNTTSWLRSFNNSHAVHNLTVSSASLQAEHLIDVMVTGIRRHMSNELRPGLTVDSSRFQIAPAAEQAPPAARAFDSL
eukprot:scaffold35397_cov34-Cyclotella_meneghiniana.AAC.4